MNSLHFSTIQNITTANITKTTTMNTTTNQNKRRRKKPKKQKKQKQNKQKQSQWTSLDVTIGLPLSTSHTTTSHTTTTHISSNHSQNSISHEKSQQMNHNWRPNTPITSPPQHNSHNQTSQPPLKEYIGTLKCFKPDRQFGYITCNDLKTDIFFHATSFIHQQMIQNIVGNSVKFNISTYNNKYNGEERQKAINISTIKTNSTAIIINNTAPKSDVNNTNWRTNNKQNTTGPNWRNNNGNSAPIKPYSAVISSKSNTCNWRDQCMTNRAASPSPSTSTTTSTCTAPESSRTLYQTGTQTGTLLFLDCVRNFGFISCDNLHENDMDINDKNHLFVHGSEIKFDKSEIYKGMRVEFMIKYYNNGQRKAIDVNICRDINDNESMISCSSISSSISSINSYIPKYRGTLVYYNSNKKHGFIRCHNQNIHKDVFVYESEFKFPKRFIKIDINVKFDIEMYKNKRNENAKRAVHVMLDNGMIMEKNDSKESKSVFEQRSKDSKWKRFRIEKCAKIDEEREDKEEKVHVQPVEIEVVDNSSDLNKDASVFVPETIQQMNKILSTIEEVDEIVMDTQKVVVASKVVEIIEVKEERVSKIGININKLFNKYKKEDNGHELIARKLCGLMNDECDLEDVFLKLFELKEKMQKMDVFLFSVLEVLSLIEGSKSIFMLINMRDMISKYLNKMLCNNYSVHVYNEFKEYGLQCLYPLMNGECDILNKCNNLQDLMVNECYNFRFYDIMYKLYDKIIPKYYNDNNVFKFIKKMVCDKDIDDSENNDKLVLLSVIISIFMKNNNLEKKELCNFIKQLCDRNILSLDVINKWRLDELDIITINKQKSLVILGDLLFQLDACKKDIVENESSMSDNEQDEGVYDNINNGYISSYNLLQQNDNHNIANRCLWRQ